MASAHNPSASIPIEAVPPTSAVPAVVQSPAVPRKALTVEDLAREIRRLDRYLAVVVLVLAFFLASFAAHNSDFWLHLATGRLIAQGEYSFGADPFSYTATESGQPWINHSWLADLLAYAVANLLGGPEDPVAAAVLVAAKALLIVALAGVMLLSCRHGASLWIPAVIVALTMLAMSPRLLLQPRCFSFLFLGLTLYLLHRPRPADQTWPRHLFLLPVLFALWVNLDSWFLLGPVTVGLYLLGQLIQQRTAPGTPGESAPPPGEIRQLAIILGAGLVACLVNPFHVRAFTLPEELWAWVSAGEWLRADPQLQAYLYSPLKSTYITNPGLGLNPNGLAFYALVLLGVVSFFLPGVSWSWGRLVLWLVFALLSLALARTIPFFAVVGGVIAALNWQDFAVHRFGAQPSLEPRRKTWSLLGRFATLVGGLALLALAWPGWLNPRPEQARLAHRTHRVAWSIEAEPSLRAAALKLADLRTNHVLTDDDHGFNFAPDVANYCAWFCPHEKGFFDYRFRLFRDVMGTFLDVREALASRPDGLLLANADWPTLFRERHINHVIVHNDRDIMLVVQHFWALPKQWTMLYADGRTAVFGWTDLERPAAAQRLRDHAVNWQALAFGPQPPPGARVPAEDLEESKARTPDVPEPVSWWTRYTRGPIPRPLAVDEAALYRTWSDFSTLQREANAKNAAIQLLASRWITSWLGPNHTVLDGFYNLALDRADQQSRGRFLFRRLIEDFYRLQNKSADPGPLLAIRAARRAVAANPQDADAYFELGLAYQKIWKQQEEPWHWSLLQQLRQIQAGTALRNALTLRPDAPGLHLFLASLYNEMPVQLYLDQAAQPGTAFFDLVIEHRREYIRLRRAVGPPPLPASDEAKDPQKAMENFVRSLEKDERDLKKFETDIDFAKRQSEYERLAANKPPLEKAHLAVRLGLVKQALDVLQEQPELSEEAKELAIRLYLATGQVQVLLDPERTSINNPRNSLLLAAAVGDYHTADLLLGQMLAQNDTDVVRGLLMGVRDQVFQANQYPYGLFGMVKAAEVYKDQANNWVVWGLLALEEGETVKAAQRLRTALEVATWPKHQAAALLPLAAASPLEALLLEVEPRLARQRNNPIAPFATLPLALGYLQALREAGTSP